MGEEQRMARKVFFSFHYSRDAWRVQQVKQIGAVEGQPFLSSNGWEEVQRQGDSAIEKWIADNMSGKSCVVVLIGSATAGRKWVMHEIQKGWNDRKGLVGIHIHGLLDADKRQDAKGRNPFSDLNLAGTPLSSIVKAYDPPYATSTAVYDHIKGNLTAWVEEAIAIRQKY